MGFPRSFKPHLSIIIPAYNEEARILPTLEKIEAFSNDRPYSCEVIIIDDCSKDKTYEIAKKFIENKPTYRLFKNLRNEGKGASVRSGMMAANGKYCLFTDADLSTPIEEAIKFLEIAKGADGKPKADIVIGSRRVAGANVAQRQPFLREFAGRVFSVLVRLMTLKGFIDTQCGFKLFTLEAAHSIFPIQTISRFGFDVEILFIAVKRFNFNVVEAPVVWYDSPQTKVRFIRDSIRMFLDLFRIRANYWQGAYKR